MKMLRMFLVVMLWIPAFAGMAAAQEDETPSSSSVVISQGIDAAETGIVYWQNEKLHAQDYCLPGDRQNYCLDMEVRSEQQIVKWTNELALQVDLANKYVVHSHSYWTAKKYLGWAYKTREAIQALYEATGRKELRIVVVALDRAIEAAERILKLLE